MRKFSIISKSEKFRRSGIEFTKKPTILTEDEITEAILREQSLEVTEIKTRKPQTKKPKKKRK